MGLAEIKAQARSSLHAAMGVPASYDSVDGVTSVAADGTLTVRWHHKLAKPGELEGGFDAVIVEGIDRLVFQQPQLTALGITLQRNDLIRIPSLGPKAEWTLEHMEDPDGPLNVYWSVSRAPE